MITNRASFIRRCCLTEEFLANLHALYSVPPNLLLGLIRIESMGLPSAMRYEKHFKWIHEPGKWALKYNWTVETEIQLQKFSYGLCQVMGATARGMGFDYPLHRLCEPQIGASWGASYLGRLYDQYKDWDDAISAYNQGSNKRNVWTNEYRNKDYVRKVRQAQKEFEDEDKKLDRRDGSV